MKALTLIQPWAWAICHAGKRIENRGWMPPATMIGQRIAIHAGKRRDPIRSFAAHRVPTDLPRMAIVATALLAHVCTQSDDKWFLGPYGWVLEEVHVLAEPIQCKGALGLWRLPVDVEAALAR